MTSAATDNKGQHCVLGNDESSSTKLFMNRMIDCVDDHNYFTCKNVEHVSKNRMNVVFLIFITLICNKLARWDKFESNDCVNHTKFMGNIRPSMLS